MEKWVLGQWNDAFKEKRIKKHIFLASAGASFENVVKFTTYLTRSQDLSAFYNKRREIFAEIKKN